MPRMSRRDCLSLLPLCSMVKSLRSQVSNLAQRTRSLFSSLGPDTACTVTIEQWVYNQSSDDLGHVLPGEHNLGESQIHSSLYSDHCNERCKHSSNVSRAHTVSVPCRLWADDIPTPVSSLPWSFWLRRHCYQQFLLNLVDLSSLFTKSLYSKG